MHARRVLVTGGSRDIGSATCTALAHAGWRVIVHAHTHVERAEAVAAALRAADADAEAVAFDVADAAAYVNGQVIGVNGTMG